MTLRQNRKMIWINCLDWAQGSRDEMLTKLMVHPKRPGRFEPRVRKRRRNGYSVMTRPRSELRAMIARGAEIKWR